MMGLFSGSANVFGHMLAMLRSYMGLAGWSAPTPVQSLLGGEPLGPSYEPPKALVNVTKLADWPKRLALYYDSMPEHERQPLYPSHPGAATPEPAVWRGQAADESSYSYHIGTTLQGLSLNAKVAITEGSFTVRLQAECVFDTHPETLQKLQASGKPWAKLGRLDYRWSSTVKTGTPTPREYLHVISSPADCGEWGGCPWVEATNLDLNFADTFSEIATHVINMSPDSWDSKNMGARSWRRKCDASELGVIDFPLKMFLAMCNAHADKYLHETKAAWRASRRGTEAAMLA